MLDSSHGQASTVSASNSLGAFLPVLLDTTLTPIVLVLVIEGLLPFLAPKVWRETFRRVTEFSDGQIRFIGLSSMLVGVMMLTVFR